MTLRLADDLDARVALARSVLAHADGHEQRAVREALAALDGAGIEELLRGRKQDTSSDDAG